MPPAGRRRRDPPAATPRGARPRARADEAVAASKIHPLDFQDVRLLVVVGTKAEEQPGVLNFGGGRRRRRRRPERRDARVDSVHGSVTYALVHQGAEIRSGAPCSRRLPANVDLPGGLFSPARHWLTLQSRSSFLIARLNDSSWRQVLQTVTARTGLEVEHPAAPVARAGHAPASLRRAGCSEDAPLEAGRDGHRPSAVVRPRARAIRACRATTRRCAWSTRSAVSRTPAADSARFSTACLFTTEVARQARRDDQVRRSRRWCSSRPWPRRICSRRTTRSRTVPGRSCGRSRSRSARARSAKATSFGCSPT